MICQAIVCSQQFAYDTRTVRMRIRELRKRVGLKQVELAEAADLSPPYMSALETGNVRKSPSIETLSRIAKVLDVRIGDLFDDAKPVAVAGKVGAGARVPLIDAFEKGGGLYHVVCPSELRFQKNIVAVQVEGDSMLPVYQDGDILFYSRHTFSVPSESLGKICVCQDTNGDAWVKYVKTGTLPDKYHLISLNPLAHSMFDVELEWAAQVLLHWPHHLVANIVVDE